MYKLIAPLFFIALISFHSVERKNRRQQTNLNKDTIPLVVLGNFVDDYGIRYTITDSLWLQKPGIKYHIIKWNIKEQYLIAKNDEKNPSEMGLYSRIDYMPFSNMEPFTWGFCLTVYNTKTDSLAELAVAANRKDPRKGCNGFPFSRMKKIDP